MNRIHINDLVNVKQLKMALETYSRIRGIDSNNIIDCLTRSINDYLSTSLKGNYSISFSNDNFELLFNNKVVKDQSIDIENKNEVVYQINKRFLNYLNEIRLDYYKTCYDPHELGMIEVKINRMYKNFILCSYKDDLEVWLDSFNLIRRDRLQEGHFIKVLPETILLNGDEIRMKATRRGIRFIEELIKNEVPEVREGTVLIKCIQRVEGIKTYVVVQSTNDFLNPIKSLIGIQGSRITEIKRNLPERLEIINWNDNPHIIIEDLFKQNLSTMDNIAHNHLHLILFNLQSNYYPDLELGLISKLFPTLKISYDLIDNDNTDTDQRE